MYPDLLPYLDLSLRLKSKRRRGGGNMFRHQMETFAILVEYGYTDQVLLKSALIHDIIEDGESVDVDTFHQISQDDEQWAAVRNLVHEVSRREIKGKEEPRKKFLERIMLHGSEKARVLKLADRISNIMGLPLTRDKVFMEKYIKETKQFILPYTKEINPAMDAELRDSIESTFKILHNEL